MFYPNYKEITVKTKVIKFEDRYIPDLPIRDTIGLCLVFCDGRNYYSYPLPSSTLGKECIAHVVYKSEADATMQSFTGKLGKGNSVCKLQDYKDIIKITVAQNAIANEKQRLIFEAELLAQVVSREVLDQVTYIGLDADECIPIWIFQNKNYEDN